MEDGDKEILVKDQRESGGDSTRWHRTVPSLWRLRYRDLEAKPLSGKIILRCVASVCAAFV